MSVKKESTAVVKQEPKQSSLALSEELLFDAQHSTGFENVDPEDISIPFIKILQALSPQTRGATKVGDATEGDFFNTVTEAVYKDHITVIPCAFQKAYVEWVPRTSGGGFVKQHLSSEILNQTKKDEKNNDVLPNGNHIVTTAYHYCLLVKADGSFERVVLSMTSTQLKKSRKWLSQMMSLQIQVGNKKITPPMFSHSYKLTAKEESNDYGSWYGWNVGSPELLSNTQLYQDAKKFHHDVTSGTVKTAEPPNSDLAVGTAADTDISDVADKF